jgi:hypothetical protein
MPKTQIHGSDVDIETSMQLAQLTLDGYGYDGSEEPQLMTGLVMRNGDVGPVTLMVAAADGYIEQVAAGHVTLRGFTSIRNNAEIHGDFASNKLANGQETNIKTVTGLASVTALIQQTTLIQIPANSEVLGVSTYVSVQPPGTSAMDVGVAGSALSRRRYGANLPTIAGSTHPGIESPGMSYLALTPITLSFNIAPSNGNGLVRITVHYRAIVPASS